MKKRNAVVLLLLPLALLAAGSLTAVPAGATDEGSHRWSDEEKSAIRSLWIKSLPPPPGDPSNAWSNDPAAALLGEKFFFDTRFSGNKKVSCGTCHRSDYSFTDSFPLAHGMGTTGRRTMPMIGMAYQSWFFWDGRKDSLWSQALGPIESPVEHGFTRTLCYLLIKEHYLDAYEQVFGPLPEVAMKRRFAKAMPAADNAVALKAWVTLTADQKKNVNRVYANMGKAIAAYGRTLMPGVSRFDTYAGAVLDGDTGLMEQTFSSQEVAGLRLFIGSAKCTNCHNGPLMTNGDFHRIGVPDEEGSFDRGRAQGILGVLSDEFNCLSEYSDAKYSDCGELRFIDTEVEKYAGAFKTPTLRNVAARPPYMHAGQFSTLREVLEFYRQVSGDHAHEGGGLHADIEHGDLTDEDIGRIETFLHTLTAPMAGVTP